MYAGEDEKTIKYFIQVGVLWRSSFLYEALRLPNKLRPPPDGGQAGSSTRLGVDLLQQLPRPRERSGGTRLGGQVFFRELLQTFPTGRLCRPAEFDGYCWVACGKKPAGVHARTCCLPTWTGLAGPSPNGCGVPGLGPWNPCPRT